MFYYLYEIKNKLNGKIYVGVHKTHDMDDGYMGSGKVIRSAIAKYGIENFIKVILEHFDDSDAMYVREREIVTDEFLARSDTYNLRRGGTGGFDYINQTGQNKWYGDSSPFLDPAISQKGNATIKKLREDAEYNNWFLSTRKTGITSEARSRGVAAARSPEAITKRKNSFKTLKHQSGERNSQFGSVWITNGYDNKKIHKTAPIPDGWRRGRTLANAG